MDLALELHNITFQFADEHDSDGNDTNKHKPLFQDLSFSIKGNRWTCLLGKSGCGKSTLLRLIGGLTPAANILQGNIVLKQGQEKVEMENYVAYMGQQDLLLPWLSVIKNVCLEEYLQTGRISVKSTTAAKALLTQLDLSDYSEYLPHKLSGGMRQRVALARTLIQQKPVVLMDEPFSALDAVSRYQLQRLAANLLQDRTVFLITHDPQEALILADDIYIMSEKPARLVPFSLPDTPPPRAINAQLGRYQQQLFMALDKGFLALDNSMQAQHD